MKQERRLEYRDNSNNVNNLNGKELPDSNSSNGFAMLSRVINNTFCCNLDNRNMLREVTVKIGL